MLALAVPSSPIHEVLALAVVELVVGPPNQVLAVVGAETTPKPTHLVLALVALDVGPTTQQVVAQLVGGPSSESIGVAVGRGPTTCPSPTT